MRYPSQGIRDREAGRSAALAVVGAIGTARSDEEELGLMAALADPRDNIAERDGKRTGSPGGGQQADEGQDNQRDAASHRRGPQKSAENTAQSI